MESSPRAGGGKGGFDDKRCDILDEDPVAGRDADRRAGAVRLLYVLSFRVGSLAAVAALVGVAFLVGGITQLAVASRVQSWRWLFIIAGILGIAAGILTVVWPAITLYVVSVLVAWYLIVFGIVHLVGALAGPKLRYWWTQLLLGIAELVLGVWAVRSWQQSLVTLVTLVGVWAIVHGVNEIFAAFSVRQAGKDAERLVG